MDFVELSTVLGNLGEFIGSVAVLATLIYLAVQVRQSKELLERNEKISLSQVNQARTDSRIKLLLAQGSDDFPSIFASLRSERGKPGFDPELLENLPENDRIKLVLLLSCGVAHFENVLYQTDLGLVPRDSIPAGIIRNTYQNWELLGLDISPELRLYYEEIKET